MTIDVLFHGVATTTLQRIWAAIANFFAPAYRLNPSVVTPVKVNTAPAIILRIPDFLSG